MAHQRPTASNVPPTLTGVDGDRATFDGPLLTRAEAHALRRSARLTHAQLKAHLKPVTALAGDDQWPQDRESSG